MLIQNKSLNSGDVIVVRFSGEEIIGRVAIGSTATTLRLTKVLRILLQMVNTEQGPAAQMTFAPYIAGADLDATIEIDLSKLVVSPVKPSKSVGDTYLAQTSSIVSANAPHPLSL